MYSVPPLTAAAGAEDAPVVVELLPHALSVATTAVVARPAMNDLRFIRRSPSLVVERQLLSLTIGLGV
jgi:hypothetical protein